MRSSVPILLAALAFVTVSAAFAAEGVATPLVVQTKKGPATFAIEVADTPERRQVGLMYRRSLADNRGMLFDFGSDTDVSMWMKNTYIPLDMVFVRGDGIVHRVENRTTPFSEAIIGSGAPVRYVIELAAGAAAKAGIARGDRVEHALIGGT